VADFMHSNPTVIHETDSVRLALKTFKQAAASMLPVVNEDQMCQGWLRLEIAFDLLHQGKVGAESAVHELLIVPFIGVKAAELVDQVLLRFAQTADRQFAVENDQGQLIGTLALLDLVLADEPINQSSARELVSDKTLGIEK
jgi:CBS domain-containing protein